MPKGKKPTGKVEVTLFFDSQKQADWFAADWLDGGLAEGMHSTRTECWGKNWFYQKTEENSCSKCGYSSPYFYNIERVPGTTYQCENCPHKYTIK